MTAKMLNENGGKSSGESLGMANELPEPSFEVENTVPMRKEPVLPRRDKRGYTEEAEEAKE